MNTTPKIENKQLLADIRVLTREGFSFTKLMLIKQWRDKFEGQGEIITLEKYNFCLN